MYVLIRDVPCTYDNFSKVVTYRKGTEVERISDTFGVGQAMYRTPDGREWAFGRTEVAEQNEPRS